MRWQHILAGFAVLILVLDHCEAFPNSPLCEKNRKGVAA